MLVRIDYIVHHHGLSNCVVDAAELWKMLPIHCSLTFSYWLKVFGC